MGIQFRGIVLPALYPLTTVGSGNALFAHSHSPSSSRYKFQTEIRNDCRCPIFSEVPSQHASETEKSNHLFQRIRVRRSYAIQFSSPKFHHKLTCHQRLIGRKLICTFLQIRVEANQRFPFQSSIYTSGPQYGQELAQSLFVKSAKYDSSSECGRQSRGAGWPRSPERRNATRLT